MKIEIKKLFGTKDINIEIDNDVCLFVGENGAGKSTILKIINSIYDYNLMELSKIPFEEIKITLFDEFDRNKFAKKFFKVDNFALYEIKDGITSTVQDLIETIKYDDLQPNEFVFDVKFRINFMNFIKNYDFNKDIENLKLDFNRFISELKIFANQNKSDIYDDINCFDFDNYYNADFLFYFGFESSKNHIGGINTKYEFMNYLYTLNKVPYGCNVYFHMWYIFGITQCLENNYKLQNSEIKIYNFYSSFEPNCNIIKDKIIFLESTPEFDCFYYNDYIGIKGHNQYKLVPFIYTYKYIVSFNHDSLEQRYLLLNNMFYENLILFYQTFRYKIKNRIYDYVRFNDESIYSCKLLSDSNIKELFVKLLNKFEINKTTKSFEYSEKLKFLKFLKLTNKEIEKLEYNISILLNHYNENIEDNNVNSNINKEQMDDLYKSIEKQIIKKFFPNKQKPYDLNACGVYYSRVKYFLEKINSLYSKENAFLDFCYNICKIIKFYNDKNTKLKAYDCSMSFYLDFFKISKIIKELASIDINEYFDTLESSAFTYLTEKYFLYKTFKLSYTDNHQSKYLKPVYSNEFDHDNSRFVPFDKNLKMSNLNILIYDSRNNKMINESNLSAGEYKILRLIKLLAFGNSNFVMLDEPELSLSLYWQSMLLNDICVFSNNNMFFIATQSTTLIPEKFQGKIIFIKK